MLVGSGDSLMASIEITGLDRIEKKYGTLNTLDAVEPAVRRGTLRNQADLATYPPQRPGSTYRRTGTLGRRWANRIERSTDSLRGITGNITPYAPQVQDAKRQMPIFKRNKWQTDVDVMTKNRSAILSDIKTALLEAFRR